MRVLQIGSDRSKRGVLVEGSPAYARQKAYAEALGALDIIGFSRTTDGFEPLQDGALHTHPTRSLSRLLYGFDAIFIASKLPWPDLVTTQDPFEGGLAALVISRFVQKPLHVQVHTDFLVPEYASHSLTNRIRVLIARYVLRRAARIRVVSERVKRSIEMQLHIAAPIDVLPIFVDTTAIRGMVPDPALSARFSTFRKRLLYVGRLESEKNPSLAIEAFAAAAPADACLIMVGSGSMRAQLELLAQECGVHDRVFFEGTMPAMPFYSIADLVVVTSRYEGYGLVIVEALAAGKPVLSTDVGIAREAGALIAEGDYADALKRWFEVGPSTAELRIPTYPSFDEYVRVYADTLFSSARAVSERGTIAR